MEGKLPEWGRKLHQAALEHDLARETYQAWKRSGNRAVPRLTISLSDGAAPIGGAWRDATLGTGVADGTRWRNMEASVVRDGQVHEVEVYFGGRIG